MDNKVGDWQDEDYEAVMLEIIDERAREESCYGESHSEGEENA
jgi:hypothetical protein